MSLDGFSRCTCPTLLGGSFRRMDKLVFDQTTQPPSLHTTKQSRTVPFHGVGHRVISHRVIVVTPRGATANPLPVDIRDSDEESIDDITIHISLGRAC